MSSRYYRAMSTDDHEQLAPIEPVVPTVPSVYTVDKPYQQSTWAILGELGWLDYSRPLDPSRIPACPSGHR
jgi:hypothetical protein